MSIKLIDLRFKNIILCFILLFLTSCIFKWPVNRFSTEDFWESRSELVYSPISGFKAGLNLGEKQLRIHFSKLDYYPIEDLLVMEGVVVKPADDDMPSAIAQIFVGKVNKDLMTTDAYEFKILEETTVTVNGEFSLSVRPEQDVVLIMTAIGFYSYTYWLNDLVKGNTESN